jgi:hypothetical protein
MRLDMNPPTTDLRERWLSGSRESHLFEQLAGGLSIRGAAEALQREPSAPPGLTPGFLVQWLSEPERADAFREARTQAAEHFVDELLAMTREVDGDPSSDGIKLLTLKVDVRRWVAARWSPENYGDKTRAEAGPGALLYKELKLMKDQDEAAKAPSTIPVTSSPQLN